MDGNLTDLMFEEIEETVEDEPITQKINIAALIVVAAVILALLADVVTVFVVRRFRRLRNQYHNTYILHHSIMNIINFLVFLILMANEIQWRLIDEPRYYHHKFMLLLADIIVSFLFAQCCLVIFMTIDWYLFALFPSKSLKYRKCTTTLIVACYLYVGIVTLYTFIVAMWNGIPGYLSVFLLVITYLISLIFFLILGVIYLCRRKDARTNAFTLNLALLKFLIWIPVIITTIIDLVQRMHTYVHYIAVTCLVISLSSSGIQLVILYFCDRNYKAALSRMFDCGKSSEAEDIEALDESVEEGAMIYNASNGEVHQVV